LVKIKSDFSVGINSRIHPIYVTAATPDLSNWWLKNRVEAITQNKQFILKSQMKK